MDNEESKYPFVPLNSNGRWLGIMALPNIHRDYGLSDEDIINAVVSEISKDRPDLIIAGNMHGHSWPLRLLKELQHQGCMVIAFMHDCHYFTGRCTHPFDCGLFETGCDARCPTADRYPQLVPDKIKKAWDSRREIFCGDSGVFLAANSNWTRKMAQRGLPDARDIEVIYLGLDTQMFKPIDRILARRLLGLPQQDFIILGGAVNVDDPHKGGSFFAEVVSRLNTNATVLVFGAESARLPRIFHTGLVRDYRKMPLIYSAADLFLATSMAESFGQTFCEASACSIPIVAFEVGGIPEIARHQVNAILTPPGDVDALIESILQLKKDANQRRVLGEQGRQLVESEFSLECQAVRWDSYLKKLSSMEAVV
jgi:glycosyltransferase involved in cell wall biosynthesis